MLRKKLVRVGATVALMFASSNLFTDEPRPSPLVGTWVLNVGKSNFGGAPPLRSYAIRMADAGAGKLHAEGHWIDSDGTESHVEFTASLDGKVTPVSRNPDADAVSLTAISANSIRESVLKAGREVAWGTYTVSADGKTLRAVEGGKDETGATYRYVEVFERK